MARSRVTHEDPADGGPPVRRDSAVVNLALEIAREFGLPAGSVWLLKPDGSKADSHQRVGDWLDAYNAWDLGLLATVRAMILEIEGKPCVHIDGRDRSVFVCRRVHDLDVNETSVAGECDWVDPEAARPDELTDGLVISCDCLKIGPGWWLDTYFDWYLVFETTRVAMSLGGDHSWVNSFLDEVRPSRG
ncbi:MAG: hypothetical protein U0800_00470 [Isosphaeraceae bacterium]